MVTARPPMHLRPYQVAAISDLRRAIAAGNRRVLLVMPTGGGKTLAAAEIIRSATSRQKRSLFLIHRKELADQALDKLSRFDIAAGLIMGQDARRDDWQPVQVASIPTLSRRMDRLPAADLVITDECHHCLSTTWRKVLEAYAGAVVIGLTATPWRSDGLGLSDFFTSHVLATTTADLTAQGFLVEADYFAYDAPDLHKVPLVAGDFRKKELSAACNTKVLVGSVVREYLAHAAGRPGIAFPVSIEHSQAIVTEFRAAGVAAAHVDCKMSTTDRTQAIRDFESGALTVLSSVGVLSEGFDAPRAEVCMLARPTMSLTLHVQQVGRVLRPSPDTGKQRALVHDHSGNILRHGPPTDITDYSPDHTPERVVDMHQCPLCNALFGSTKQGRCPACGEAIKPYTPRVAGMGGGREDLLQVDGIRIGIETIRKMREERARKGLDRELTDEQLARVARATRHEKAAEYLRLREVAASKGFKDGFPAAAFRACFGHWPGFAAEELQGVTPARRPFLPLPRRRGDSVDI